MHNKTPVPRSFEAEFPGQDVEAHAKRLAQFCFQRDIGFVTGNREYNKLMGSGDEPISVYRFTINGFPAGKNATAFSGTLAIHGHATKLQGHFVIRKFWAGFLAVPGMLVGVSGWLLVASGNWWGLVTGVLGIAFCAMVLGSPWLSTNRDRRRILKCLEEFSKAPT